MKQPKYAKGFEVAWDLPDALRPLVRLAYNLRWTWDHDTRRLFRLVDEQAWEATGHNPVAMLQELSSSRAEALTNDKAFIKLLRDRVSALDEYLSEETWFDRAHPERRADTRVAYFCAEFGLSESLPIYSGGLGVLAGDHLKAASDLGIPLVGVGLLYARGYFKQFIGPDGWQQETFPQYDFYQHPIRLAKDDKGSPIRVEVAFPDRTVRCQVWKAEVGRVMLYLLDSNVLENLPADQEITDTLYGGDEDMRIRQELILGQGGFRALEAVGWSPTACHMNEGHAAFMTLERMRSVKQSLNADLRTARQIVVNGNVFTTHTPVPAGFDKFQEGLLRRYTEFAVKEVGLSFDEFERMGRIHPESENESFNMAVFALRNSNYINGVSKLHAQVSRQMFAAIWPDHAEAEVPISAVTNGIHTLSWISREMGELLDRHLGKIWRESPNDPASWAALASIPASDLWEVRQRLRSQLVHLLRRLMRRRDEREGYRGLPERYEGILDPQILTIGFARRFATYKRATLLFREKERLKALLNHPERPIQLIIAGKSHPRDDGGKKLIQDIHHFVEAEGVGHRVVFVEDYDVRIARALVQGVDVWLNNPRRPMEASGTSGMKAIPNAVLNCSILDGWWDEAYDDRCGWAIGNRREVSDEFRQDWLDSLTLYRLLEEEIAPMFYKRRNGVPLDWVAMVKHSMAELAPRFSTHRMLQEYCDSAYLPASSAFNQLAQPDLKAAKDALVWRDRVRAAWPKVLVESVSSDATQKVERGQQVTLSSKVVLGGLEPSDVRVEALVGRAGSDRELHDWRTVELMPKGDGVFAGSFDADVSGQMAYIIRVVPKHDLVRPETELRLVRWQATYS